MYLEHMHIVRTPVFHSCDEHLMSVTVHFPLEYINEQLFFLRQPATNIHLRNFTQLPVIIAESETHLKLVLLKLHSRACENFECSSVKSTCSRHVTKEINTSYLL